MNRDKRIENLKYKIQSHLDNGGSLNDSKKNIPYYSYLIDCIKKDARDGVDSSVESLYKECGFEYISRKKEVTLDRIKKEIDNFVKNNGDIYSKREDLPYYELMCSFIKKHSDEDWSVRKVYEACGYNYRVKKQDVTLERLKEMVDTFALSGGDIYDRVENIPYYDYMCNLLAKYKRNGINYNLEDLMRLCGYEYLNHRRNNYKLMKIFDSVKDEWGYIDSLKESEDGKRILYCIQERAKNKQMNVNDYLIVSFGVRFSFTYSDVDYVSLVENDLLEFSKKYGCENVNHKFIEENDTRLLYRIVHLSRYFPCGSVTPSSVIEFFGYVSETKEKKFIDEQLTLKKLYMLFPDRKVYGLTKIRYLYQEIIKLSTRCDQTIEQYLNSKGFEMVISKNVYRLSKAKLNNDDNLFKCICNIRDKMLKESKIINDPNSTQMDVSEELEKISGMVSKEVERVKIR